VKPTEILNSNVSETVQHHVPALQADLYCVDNQGKPNCLVAGACIGADSPSLEELFNSGKSFAFRIPCT
jgi:hypothetical protein